AGDYRSDIEQRLSAALGQQVQIGSVEGSWRRFNPVLSLQQVLIFPANEASGSARQLDHLSLELGVAASIVAQNWSLAHVSIQGPELTLAEQADGSWQLQGFEQSSDKGIDLNAILQLVSRVGDF